MARFLIDRASSPGDTVLDPFCGSGAVLVESMVNDRNAVGVDFNPYAVLLATAKTTAYDDDLLETQLKEILTRLKTRRLADRVDFPNADYWFTPATLHKLGVLRAVLCRYAANLDQNYGSFWTAVAAATVRACSRADTRGPKPFISKKARENRLGRHFDPLGLFEQRATVWITQHRQYVAMLSQGATRRSASVLQGDSRALSCLLKGQAIDAVVTSPPYLNAQDYYRSSKLELFSLGLSSPRALREWSREVIGSDRIASDPRLLNGALPCGLAEEVRAKLADKNAKSARVFAKYSLDMDLVLGEIWKVLKEGGYCAMASSYNLLSGVVVPTSELVAELASKQGFRLESCYMDRIRDRWVPTQRNGHEGVIREEHLLLFRRASNRPNGQ
jgi:hypothetical protein